MDRVVTSFVLAALCISRQPSFITAAKAPRAPTGGCDISAAITIAVGSGRRPENGLKVLDSNLRTKWASYGEGESLWMELASPTKIDSVAVAFRKGRKRVHKFSIFLVTTDNQAKLMFKGKSSGRTDDLQVFSLGDKAQEAVAVSIVGHGNSKNMWNGYSEVQICSTTTETQNGGTGESEEEEPQQQSEEQPTLNVMPVTNDVELPFPEGRKGFNVVNMCSFPIRVGSTGNEAACGAGTTTNPNSGKCFWALPQGNRDLIPGQAVQYVLPELGLKEGSLIWAGNIWASTGCTSDISDKYDHPTVSTCVTNHCPSDGVCSDYWGPSGVTSKAEFAMQEGGLDFYDVSLIDGANIPMEIVPIDPIYNVNDHYCGIPGFTGVSGDLGACGWGFSPEAVEGYDGEDLSPYTRVVWPPNPDEVTTCLTDTQCEEAGVEGVCGVYEERKNAGESTTGAVVPNVCGRVVGWMGAQTACGASTKDGEAFPNDFPYDCQRAARHGTYKQLYRCTGSVYGSEACYLMGAEDSCCGCPSWDTDNGGCLATNPDWTHTAYPWANFFKSACPTAYSFPRDDRTSMFVCSNEEDNGVSDSSKNTQSYAIRFCPGDSEKAFYK